MGLKWGYVEKLLFSFFKSRYLVNSVIERYIKIMVNIFTLELYTCWMFMQIILFIFIAYSMLVISF